MEQGESGPANSHVAEVTGRSNRLSQIWGKADYDFRPTELEDSAILYLVEKTEEGIQ